MATLVKDPVSQTFSGVPSSSTGRTMVDLNGGGAAPAAGGADPYTIFNKNVAQILMQIQNAQTKGNATMGGALDKLTTQSVTSMPYDANMKPTDNIALMGSMPSAFSPAITSISTQQKTTGDALSALKDSLTGMSTIFQPRDLAPGSSLVSPAGEVMVNGTSYSVVADPTNPGQFKAIPTNSISPGGMAGSTPATIPGQVGGSTGGSIVAGVDLSGKATGVGSYATDPNHAHAISSIYSSLSKTYPQATADTLTTYIAGHASKSPVTGQMIMNAASQYGVDPNLLAALLAQESDFGTAGAAVGTLNPGNVGNTDNGSRKAFTSWQAGVNAAAYELSRRKVPAGYTGDSTVTAPTPLNMGSQASNYAQDVIGGKRSYTDAVDGMALYGNAGKVILDSVIRAAKPDFNFAQANTLAAQQGSIGPNLEYAKAALDNLKTASSNLSIWGQNSNVPILGGLANWFSMQSGLGKQQTSTKAGAVGEAQQAIASVLAAIKGGTPTEYGSQAKALLPDNPTPADIAAAAANLTALGDTKQGIYGTPGSSGGSAGGTPKGSMTDRDYVEKVLSSNGMKYADVVAKIPAGHIGAINNATGALVQMLPSDFDPAKYTHI